MIDPQGTAGRKILITGGSGSLGRALLEHFLRSDEHRARRPRSLVVYSRSEALQSDVRQLFPETQVEFILGDVRDPDRLRQAFRGVACVIHAAAQKQIGSVEDNPVEAIKTNVVGTMNVINAARDAGVQRVVGISSDKAVHPANLYGATKFSAEKLLLEADHSSGPRTKFSVARYGNVIGSRGSVVQVFLDRRARCGEVSITDQRMTRFMISLPEAATFVCLTLHKMRGGEVFIPKMRSMNIMDIARTVAPKSSTRVIGIRPGEKLHEELIAPEESQRAFYVPEYGCFVLQPRSLTALGTRLPPSFSYDSKNNKQIMTQKELAVHVLALEDE